MNDTKQELLADLQDLGVQLEQQLSRYQETGDVEDLDKANQLRVAYANLDVLVNKKGVVRE